VKTIVTHERPVVSPLGLGSQRDPNLDCSSVRLVCALVERLLRLLAARSFRESLFSRLKIFPFSLSSINGHTARATNSPPPV
jgi:transcriptional regulator of aromatic amino acid metabolism